MKSCVNCKYSRDVGPYLACYGQKYAPKVDWDYMCEDWKPKYATNSDRIRAMTDKELAHLIGEFTTCENCLAHSDACEMEYDNPAEVPSCEQIWLDWLKQEVKDGD